MRKLKINKKIIVAMVFGMMLIAGFLILPIAAKAQDIPLNELQNAGTGGGIFPSAKEIATAIFRFLGSIVAKIATFFLNLALGLFQSVLQEGFNGQPDIAAIGWKVARDVANMVFILVMIVIAFATILRIERYGIKQLLPRLIIIALLINFSMVLCFVLVDFTNILANYFINNAQTDSNGNKVQLAQVFIDGFHLPEMYTAGLCENFLTEKELCKSHQDYSAEEISACETKYQEQFDKCDKVVKDAAEKETEEESILHVLVSEFGSAALIFIAAFIVGVGAILLFIRVIAIWILVIISPLAFICFILPSLRTHWENWLHQFIRWCIFAPVYTFFIWLAAQICMSNKLEKIGNRQSNLFLDQTTTVNQFFSDMKYAFGFVFLGALLIAGLITANKLGIAGAGAAMALGKKWTGAAKGAIKGAVKGRLAATGKEVKDAYAGAARRVGGKVLQKIPGFKTTGARMEMKGEVQMERIMASKKIKDREQLYQRMSTQQRADILNRATTPSADKLALAQIMKEKDLKKVDTKSAENIRNIFTAYGRRAEAKSVENARLDTLKLQEKAQRIKELENEGKLGEVHAISLQDTATQQAWTENVSHKGAISYANMSRENKAAMRAAYDRAYDRDKERFKDTYSELMKDAEAAEMPKDEEKKKTIGEYVAKKNQLPSVSDAMASDKAFVEGAIKARDIDALTRWAESNANVNTQLKATIESLANENPDDGDIQKSNAVLNKTLAGLNNIMLAEFAQKAKPDYFKKMKAEFHPEVKDGAKILAANIDINNLINSIKNTSSELGTAMVKAIKEGAKAGEAGFDARLRQIKSDRAVDALYLTPDEIEKEKMKAEKEKMKIEKEKKKRSNGPNTMAGET